MKGLLLICALLLFIGIAKLPIGYYTLLRIVVSIGSIAVVLFEFKNGFNFWVIAFGLVAILFNPLLPVYLHNKSAWMPIDIICGVLFAVKAFLLSNNKINQNEN